jgi:L-2-hydroxyglutarate oxidase LhgO
MAQADVDTLVIGAGVVGLAVARALAATGRETLVIEACDGAGQGASSRNSEVIHAGVYYAPGSLKARLCVAGRGALYGYCASRGVAHRRCGKLLVAAHERQREQLLSIQTRARANGVKLALLDRAALNALEPEAEGVAALYSPDTGIVDSHALMLALRGDAEAQGATFAFRAPALGGRVRDDGVEVSCGGDAPLTLLARRVVIAAGLSARRVARSISGLAQASVPRAWFAKGSYFALARRSPFTRLVYPVPEPGGLGVHLTLDLGGRARFGPDVEWLDVEDERAIDYRVDPSRAGVFYDAIRRYWPGLRDGDLMPDYAGVRAKIVGPGVADADFQLHGSAEHGAKGVLALYGVESPGLTSSLALADEIVRRLDDEEQR